MTEEQWKDGAEYPNRYDRVCKQCKTKIPKNGRDYFYRKTPGGDYECMCRSCMEEVPPEPTAEDRYLATLERIAVALERLATQGAK